MCVTDSDKLSGAELASTNHRSEYILRDLEDSKWEPQSQVRKLLFQKILMMVLHEEDDCSQLFFYDGGLVSVFTNFFNKVISRQSNSESSLGTRSWQNGTCVAIFISQQIIGIKISGVSCKNKLAHVLRF